MSLVKIQKEIRTLWHKQADYSNFDKFKGHVVVAVCLRRTAVLHGAALLVRRLPQGLSISDFDSPGDL